MFQTCRPAGRLFYLVLAVVVAASSVRPAARAEGSAGKAEKPAISSEAEPRAKGPSPRAASPAPQGGGTLTSVIDTVYMADGSAAQGVLVITWPAFVTASGTAAAAGALDVTLGAGGALNVALEPNAGATPPGVYYTGRVSVRTGRSANRVLGGADKFSGNAGTGADDAGNGNGGATGIPTVCEHGTSGQGE